MNKSSYKLVGPISDHLIWTKLNQPNKRATNRTHFRPTKVMPISFNKLATTHEDPISDPWEPPTKLWEPKRNHFPKSGLRVLGAVGSDNAPSPPNQNYRNLTYTLSSKIRTPIMKFKWPMLDPMSYSGPISDTSFWIYIQNLISM